MVRHCSAQGCLNTKSKCPDKSFHRFPLGNDSILQKWVAVLGRKNFVATKTSYICSDHFTESDFQVRPEASHRMIKAHAVPSIFLSLDDVRADWKRLATENAEPAAGTRSKDVSPEFASSQAALSFSRSNSTKRQESVKSMTMSVLNQAHVEAICSATYLENYLDCLEALPDDLQKILTQIREVDVRLSDLEKDTAPFEEVFVNLKDGEIPDSSFVSQLHRMLLRMQEFEDEKIQLSNSLMEYIENRTKQLDADRENLDPANHTLSEAPARTGSACKKPNNDTKNSTVVHSSASNQSLESSKELSKQVEQRLAASASKKRKPKMDSPVVSKAPSTGSKSASSAPSKCTSNAPSKTANSTPNSNSNSSNSREIKEDTPAKKQSTVNVQQEAPSGVKRKRRSRAGTQAKSQKEISTEPIEPEEPTYCICDQISYGEMVGCDNDACPVEWFHFDCVGVQCKPKGKWYCPKCRGDKQTVMRRGADKGR
ncbi:inhibitor of growth protein 1-like [Watersipora subatra]|uniref:inhibitor of growth protein 1-like n=1 Tax=Watersipora subatra TaxID=2589382 RepID=UPI00355C13BC